ACNPRAVRPHRRFGMVALFSCNGLLVVGSSSCALTTRRTQVAMIKLVYCIAKKPGMTDVEFFDYWKNVHGPIGARIPRLAGLSKTNPPPSPGASPPRDSAAWP